MKYDNICIYNILTRPVWQIWSTLTIVNSSLFDELFNLFSFYVKNFIMEIRGKHFRLRMYPFCLIQFSINITNNPIKKWAVDLNRHLFQRGNAGVQTAREKMFNIANHQRNAEQKHTLGYHLIPVRMAIIQKNTNNTRWEDMEKRAPVGGNVNWYGHCGKQCGSFSKN